MPTVRIKVKTKSQPNHPNQWEQWTITMTLIKFSSQLKAMSRCFSCSILSTKSSFGETAPVSLKQWIFTLHAIYVLDVNMV